MRLEGARAAIKGMRASAAANRSIDLSMIADLACAVACSHRL